MMTIGSLFSGVGGLELGLEAAGWGPVAWQVEADAWCRGVLSRRWPGADRSVTDVRETTGALARVDLICGGFPCQDVSGAGRGAGLAGERSGLWYEFARIIGELTPKFVVIENVRSGAKRWVDPVCGQLADLGYRVRALGISARDVGAPHRRSRVFVIGVRRDVGDAQGVGRPQPWGVSDTQGWAQPVRADARREWPTLLAGDARGVGGRQDGRGHLCRSLSDRIEEESESRVLNADWCEALMGFPLGWTGTDTVAHDLPRRWPAGRGEPQHDWEPPRTVPARTQRDRTRRVRALGNAVVPACAYVAGVVLREMVLSEFPLGDE